MVKDYGHLYDFFSVSEVSVVFSFWKPSDLILCFLLLFVALADLLES